MDGRKERQQQRLQRKVVIDVIDTTLELNRSTRDPALIPRNGRAPILDMLTTQHKTCIQRRLKALGYEGIDGVDITELMQGRSRNKKLTQLSREIKTRLNDASATCLLKLVSGKVTQQPPLSNGFLWLQGRLSDAEYSAFRDGRLDLLNEEGYYATTVVYEIGHGGDKEHVLGVAQLTRPSAAQARWALLDWKLKSQLAEAMLVKLEEEYVKQRRAVSLFGSGTAADEEDVLLRLRRLHDEETLLMLEACEKECNDDINAIFDKQTPRNVIEEARDELKRLKQTTGKSVAATAIEETDSTVAIAVELPSESLSTFAEAARTQPLGMLDSEVSETPGRLTAEETQEVSAAGRQIYEMVQRRLEGKGMSPANFVFHYEYAGMQAEVEAMSCIIALEREDVRSSASLCEQLLRMMCQALSEAPTTAIAMWRGRCFVELGAVGSVVRCMWAMPKELHVVGWSCRLLSGLMLPDDACKDAFLRIGGTEVVIGVMENFCENAQVCIAAASVLWNLSAGPPRCTKTIVNANGVVACVELITRYEKGDQSTESGKKVVEAANATLANLSEDGLLSDLPQSQIAVP